MGERNTFPRKELGLLHSRGSTIPHILMIAHDRTAPTDEFSATPPAACSVAETQARLDSP